MIEPVAASTSGTQYHKGEPAVPKFWYEAKNEEGESYYWHIESGQSR